MDVRLRAALLGLLVGSAHTALRLLVFESASTALGASLTELVLQTLLTTLLALAVILGLPLYGALRMDVSAASPVWLAAAVAAGAGIAVFVTYPFLSAGAVGAPFGDVLRVRLAAAYLVNAVSPAAYSGVAALAGFLLAEQNT